jgi:membrane protein
MSDDGARATDAPARKPGIKDRIAAANPFLAHVIRMVDHYGAHRGNLAAGGATYFGFLSFFPLLAVSFAIVGQLAEVYPDAQQDFVDALGGVLPGIVSVDPAPGRIALSDIASNAPAIYTVGLLTALYAGLNWVSGLRDGLNQMLDLPTADAGNIVKGKLTDLLTLVVLGAVLLVSVSVGGLPVALGSVLLDAVGLGGPVGTVVLTLLAVVVGVGVSTVLFWAIFRLLPKPDLPERALWRGALLAAVGFELVKQFASLVLRGASSVPVASLAIALTLVVWIYFFSRLVMYGISWACTDESTLAELAALESRPDAGGVVEEDVDVLEVEPGDVGYVRPLAVGFGAGALLGAFLGRATRDD